jgi:hypothetical protein
MEKMFKSLLLWFQKRRLLNDFLIGSYVKTMSADGGHFEPRSGSLNDTGSPDPLVYVIKFANYLPKVGVSLRSSCFLYHSNRPPQIALVCIKVCIIYK